MLTSSLQFLTSSSRPSAPENLVAKTPVSLHSSLLDRTYSLFGCQWGLLRLQLWGGRVSLFQKTIPSHERHTSPAYGVKEKGGLTMTSYMCVLSYLISSYMQPTGHGSGSAASMFRAACSGISNKKIAHSWSHKSTYGYICGHMVRYFAIWLHMGCPISIKLHIPQMIGYDNIDNMGSLIIKPTI